MNQKIKNDAQGAELKTYTDDNTRNMVLSMLTTYPQDRFTLAEAIGITERTFREAVHDLRQEGHLIISESRGKGYRLGTRKEAYVMAKELESRAMDLLRTSRVMMGLDPNQITLKGVVEDDVV